MLTVLLPVEDYSYTGCFSTTQVILSSDLAYLSLLPESLCQPRLGLLLPCGSDGKESACNAGNPGSIPWSGRFTWRREWQPFWVFLPGKSHGQRSLVGYSLWGHKELDMTTWLTFLLSVLWEHLMEKEMATHSSVLAWRIPGTGGALWAAVYGIAQSRTRLKRLSSSSSSNTPLQHNTKLLSLVCLTIFIVHSLFLMLTHCLFIGDIKKICRINICQNSCYNKKMMVSYWK